MLVFGRKKLLFLAGKTGKISDFSQKKPSGFGEDLSFVFGDHLFLSRKIAKISDFSQKKPSDFGEDLFFLEIT